MSERAIYCERALMKTKMRATTKLTSLFTIFWRSVTDFDTWQDSPGCYWKKIIICDGCDEEFNYRRLPVPLEAPPEEDWFCTACTAGDVPAMKQVSERSE